jgi:hypothetical protein
VDSPSVLVLDCLNVNASNNLGGANSQCGEVNNLFTAVVNSPFMAMVTCQHHIPKGTWVVVMDPVSAAVSLDGFQEEDVSLTLCLTTPGILHTDAESSAEAAICVAHQALTGGSV